MTTSKSTPGSFGGPDVWAKRPPSILRRFRWLFIAGGVLLFLLLLVALAPTIAGMGWVRSLVLDHVNNDLNGTVEIEDWSLGWFSGTEITNLRIQQKDAQGQRSQILECRHLSTDL